MTGRCTANATLASPPGSSARPDLTTFKRTQEKPLAQRWHLASLEHLRPVAKLCFATRDGFRRHPCRCLWRGSAHTTKTTPRRLTILHLSQMRRTLARTFILAIVATVAHAFNGNRETDGKPSTIETQPPDPQGGGQETGRNDKKFGFLAVKTPIIPKLPPHRPHSAAAAGAFRLGRTPLLRGPSSGPPAPGS